MSGDKSEKRNLVRFLQRMSVETKLFSEIKALDEKLDSCYRRLGMMAYNKEKGAAVLPQNMQKVVVEIENIKKSIEKRRKRITMSIEEIKRVVK